MQSHGFTMREDNDSGEEKRSTLFTDPESNEYTMCRGEKSYLLSYRDDRLLRKFSFQSWNFVEKCNDVCRVKD